MKNIGILWNYIGEYYQKAIDDINRFGTVEKVYSINMEEDFLDFVKELYPFTPEGMWKAEYKFSELVNQYKDNRIHILVIDMPESKKVYLPDEDKYIYENVLELKVFMHRKYKHLLKENSFEDIFYMTNDKDEFEHDFLPVVKYLSKYYKDESPLAIDPFISSEPKRYEMITPNVMFKTCDIDIHQAYNELFNMYLMKEMGLNNSPNYWMISYGKKEGIITEHLAKDGEKMISASQIINRSYREYFTFEKTSDYLKKFCDDFGYPYDESIELELEKLYIYDLLTLQIDRHGNNWGIITGNNKTRLYYLDNAFMISDCSQEAALDLKDGIITPDELINEAGMFDFLRDSDVNDNYPPTMLIREYLKNSNVKQWELFESLLNGYNLDTFEKVFGLIEQNHNLTVPSEYKRLVLECFEYIKTYTIRTMDVIGSNTKLFKHRKR